MDKRLQPVSHFATAYIDNIIVFRRSWRNISLTYSSTTEVEGSRADSQLQEVPSGADTSHLFGVYCRTGQFRAQPDKVLYMP